MGICTKLGPSRARERRLALLRTKHSQTHLHQHIFFISTHSTSILNQLNSTSALLKRQAHDKQGQGLVPQALHPKREHQSAQPHTSRTEQSAKGDVAGKHWGICHFFSERGREERLVRKSSGTRAVEVCFQACCGLASNLTTLLAQFVLTKGEQKPPRWSH